MVNKNDYTMMRGLVMDFPNDTKVFDIKDQYMFGPSILVAPVTDAAVTKRNVYLPNGTKWINFWTGETIEGGKTISASAPLDKLPLFIKAGSIVPFGPDLQYALEKNVDPIELRVYTGANGSFSLYEDENTNNNYLKGKSSAIKFDWNEATSSLTIGAREGSFDGILKDRSFIFFFVSNDQGNGELESKSIDKTVKYTGATITIKK